MSSTSAALLGRLTCVTDLDGASRDLRELQPTGSASKKNGCSAYPFGKEYNRLEPLEDRVLTSLNQLVSCPEMCADG